MPKSKQQHAAQAAAKPKRKVNRVNYVTLLTKFVRFVWQKRPLLALCQLGLWVFLLAATVANNLFYVLITSRLLGTNLGAVLLIGKFVVDACVMGAGFWLDNLFGHLIRVGILGKLFGAEARSYEGDDPYSLARAADCGYKLTRENPLPGLLQFWSALVTIGAQLYLLYTAGNRRVAEIALGSMVVLPILLWWWGHNVGIWGSKKHAVEDELSSIHRTIVRYGVAGRLFGSAQRSLQGQAVEKSELYFLYNLRFQITSLVPGLVGLVLVVVLFTIGLHQINSLVLAAAAQIGVALASIASLQDKAGKLHAIIVHLREGILGLPQQPPRRRLPVGATIEVIEAKAVDYAPPLPGKPDPTVADVSVMIKRRECLVVAGLGGAGKAAICRLLTGFRQATGRVKCLLRDGDGKGSMDYLTDLDLRPAVIMVKPDYYIGAVSVGAMLMRDFLGVQWGPGQTVSNEVIERLKRALKVWGQGGLWEEFARRAAEEALGDSARVVELGLRFLLEDWAVWERLSCGLETSPNRVNAGVKHVLAVMVALLYAIVDSKQIVWLDEPERDLDEELKVCLVRQIKRFRQVAPDVLLLISTTSQEVSCLLGSRGSGKVAFVEAGRLLACAPHEELLGSNPSYKWWWDHSLRDIVREQGFMTP